MKRIMLMIGMIVIGMVIGGVIMIHNIEITGVTKDTVEITVFGNTFEYGYTSSRDFLM